MTLEEKLQKIRVGRPQVLISVLDRLVLNAGTNLIRLPRQAEAFSFPEVIDKLLIILVKDQYIKDKNKLKQNTDDFIFIEKIVEKGFKNRSIKNRQKLMSAMLELWDVNVEIFCLNDICMSDPDDSIVAASSRKMVAMMKERNRLKLVIGECTGDVVHEVKQYGL